MSTETPECGASRPEDGSKDNGIRQKLSVVQLRKRNVANAFIVESNNEQLLVSLSPRAELSVAVAATGNVAHSEIEAALEEALAEVRHTRAIAGDGFDDLADLDGGEGR